jgi:hypothetical protein
VPKGSSSKGQGKSPMMEHDHVPKGVCRHCKQKGHYMRDCVEFIKWLNIRLMQIRLRQRKVF